MVGLPRLHGKLGAKRVEVTAREAAGKEIGRVSLKTCQQQHVGSLDRSTEPNCLKTSGWRVPGKSSRGWPAIHRIADCRLPISDWKLADYGKTNRQSEIGNWK